MIKSDTFKQLPVTGKGRKHEVAIRKKTTGGKKKQLRRRGEVVEGLESGACNLDVSEE